MNREELVILIALVLFFSFILGWLMRWAYGKMGKVNSANMTDVDDLANRLHEAEIQRDEATQRLNDQEWEYTNKVTQTEAELQAAMEGLGEARREAEDLRMQLKRKSKK